MTNRIIRQALAFGLMALWLAVPAAEAQVKQDWVAQYSGPPPIEGWYPSDWVTDLAVRDGYVYVTGYESQFTAYWATVKYDYDGQEQWVQRVVDGQSQHAEALAVDAAGNVYVTGYQKQFSAGIDVLTVKYSPDGDILWEQLYVSPGGNNQPNEIAFDASGNIYIAGASWNAEQEEFDFLLLKYDADGNLLWDRTLDNGDEQWDAALALAIDPNGNAIVAGFTEPEAYLVKYSPAGDLLWDEEHVSYAPWDQWAQVITDATGNIYVLGEISLPGTPKYLWTAKYDPDGNILWEQPYTGTADESCYDGNLALMPDGGVVITGQSWDLPFNINIVTIRYAPDGTKLWQRLENAGYAQASGDDVVVDAEGRIYVTGYGYNYSYQEDIITLGYSPDGDLLWTQIYADPEPDQSDYPQAIAVDEAANVFVAAHSWDYFTSNDFTTIRYQQGVSPELTCLPDSGTLPFNVQFSVSLTNAFPGSARLIDGRISVALAGGQFFPNWKTGQMILGAGDSYTIAFNQMLPDIGPVIGTNTFTLIAEDTTPSPYNQPPYPPSGYTDTSVCEVVGIAP